MIINYEFLLLGLLFLAFALGLTWLHLNRKKIKTVGNPVKLWFGIIAFYIGGFWFIFIAFFDHLL